MTASVKKMIILYCQGKNRTQRNISEMLKTLIQESRHQRKPGHQAVGRFPFLSHHSFTKNRRPVILQSLLHDHVVCILTAIFK